MTSAPTLSLEYARDALAASVEIALRLRSLVAHRERARGRSEGTAAQFEHVGALEAAVVQVLATAAQGGDAHAAGRYALALTREAHALATRERDALREQLEWDLAQIEGDVRMAYHASLRPLETLLRRHDFPRARSTVYLRAGEHGRYTALLRTRAPEGITATVALEVPDGHPLARVTRLDALAGHLEVHAPDEGGWFHRSAQLRAFPLDRYRLFELALQGEDALIRLRGRDDGSGEGFDLTLHADPPRATVLHVDAAGAAVGEVHEAHESEAHALRALREKLTSRARELLTHRTRLVDLRIDGRAYTEASDALVLVERLVQTFATPLCELASASPSRDTIEHAATLPDGRRESTALPLADVRALLLRVPAPARAAFAPLASLAPEASPPDLTAEHPHDAHAPHAPPRAPVSAPPPAPEDDAMLMSLRALDGMVPEAILPTRDE